MMTKEQLAELLRTAPVKDLAREADVSVKTIYRLRHMKNSPTLSTVESLIAAIGKLNPPKRVKRRAKATV